MILSEVKGAILRGHITVIKVYAPVRVLKTHEEILRESKRGIENSKISLRF